MLHGLKCRLAKKNILPKIWHSLIIESGESLSHIVVLAVYYYYKTGKYLDLGVIGEDLINENNQPEIKLLQLYFPDSDWYWQWKKNLQEIGTKVSPEIVRILEGGLKGGVVTELADTHDLENQVNSLKIPSFMSGAEEPKKEHAKKLVVLEESIKNNEKKYSENTPQKDKSKSQSAFDAFMIGEGFK